MTRDMDRSAIATDLLHFTFPVRITAQRCFYICPRAVKAGLQKRVHVSANRFFFRPALGAF